MAIYKRKKYLQDHVLHSLVVNALKLSALLVEDYYLLSSSCNFSPGRIVRKQCTCKLRL